MDVLVGGQCIEVFEERPTLETLSSEQDKSLEVSENFQWG